MRLGSLAITGALVLCGAISPPPPALAPVTGWQLRQDAETCRVFRAFGDDSNPGFFQLKSFGPTSAYELTVAGAAIPRQPGSVRKLQAGWDGALGPPEQMGVLGTVGPLPSVTMLATDRASRSFQFFYDGHGHWFAPLSASAGAFAVRVPGSPALSLKAGSLAEPLQKLHDCESALLEKWGWGRDYFARVPVQAQPEDPHNFYPNAMIYPAILTLNRISGITQLRLKIDTRGKVAQCVVQSSSGSELFGAKNCDRLKKSGAFTAARDGQDKPVESYQQLSISFATFN